MVRPDTVVRPPVGLVRSVGLVKSVGRQIAPKLLNLVQVPSAPPFILPAQSLSDWHLTCCGIVGFMLEPVRGGLVRSPVGRRVGIEGLPDGRVKPAGRQILPRPVLVHVPPLQSSSDLHLTI